MLYLFFSRCFLTVELLFFCGLTFRISQELMVEYSRSIKLTVLLSNGPIKLTALLSLQPC